jgi:hypothetical protein
MSAKRWLWLTLLLSGCGVAQLPFAAAAPTATPTTGFVQRYASPEEIAPIATAAAENCGKPYFGTYCKLADGTYGYVPAGSR